PAGDGCLDARLGDVLANPPLLPFGVAWPEALLAELLLLVGRNLVVGDQNRSAAPSVLPVEPHHRVSGSSRPGEQVDDNCARLRTNHETQTVLDCIQRLGIGELASGDKCAEQPRTVALRVMRFLVPLGRRKGRLASSELNNN